MTEQDQTSTPNELNPLDDAPSEPAAAPDAPEDAAFDVSAALASITQLDRLAATPQVDETEADAEAEEYAEFTPVDSGAENEVESPQMTLSGPPLMTFERGQAASVIPALLLIGIGTWLTFTFTLSQTSPSPWLLLLLILGASGLILLAAWISSARWAQGSLLSGMILFLSAAGLFLIGQAGISLERGWPALLTAIGLALLLTSWLGRASGGTLRLPGLALIAASAAAWAYTHGWIAPALLGIAWAMAPVVLLVLLLLVLLPIFRRGRS